MVLGLKTKGQRSTTIQVDFLVHVQDIKPWPPSKALKSVKSVVLQWINGDHNFGSYSSEVVNGEIGFGETFRLPTILHSDGKNKKRDKYPNNYLEFGLYEPPPDKAVKHQLLGSVSINLAEYAYSKETVNISCPVYFHKSSRGSVQPILSVNLQLLSADNSGSSSRNSFSKDASLDKDGSQSINEIMSNEDEVGIASFTDEDDTSSYSSQMTLSASETSVRSGHRSEQNPSELVRDSQKKTEGSDPYSRGIPVEPEASRTTENVNGQQTAIERASEFYNNKHKLNEDERNQHENGQGKTNLEEKNYSEAQFLREKQVSPNNIPPRYTRGSSTVHRITPNQKLKHMKSVQFPFNSAWSTGSADGRQMSEASSENPTSTTNVEYESRINLLEEELREAAAIEIGLYSVVAEHGSSTSKVHAPARRLSRFYIHTWKKGSASKRASAARAIVSGLVLVSKACGNDVARLTFWLSNAIMLRIIVCRRVEGPASYAKPYMRTNTKGMETNGRLPGAWLPPNKAKANGLNIDDWEDPKAFTFALEKFESWVFSRVVESVWWQSLTPNMQTAAAKSSNPRKTSVMKHGVGDQAQGNFSIDLWKKAFKDAWERLCPIRAGGHECGCLPLMAKKAMEQLVARLDVAMLNAVLRASADEMPTDPISDPISDSKVLPIPAGKSSFGAGAQLKNAIGSWSRWLSDLFDIEDSELSGEDVTDPNAQQQLGNEMPFKPFRLLNELSDLMMLPAEMLAERTTRKEICPTFGSPLVKIVLFNFVPDEFNPDPIPGSIFETLDSEDLLENDDEEILSCFPVGAVPLQYSPPTPLSLAKLIGELGNKKHTRNGSSSILKKSYTSDDELDELDSPAIASIMGDSPMPRSEGGRKVVRYQLLREIWNESK